MYVFINEFSTWEQDLEIYFQKHRITTTNGCQL